LSKPWNAANAVAGDIAPSVAYELSKVDDAGEQSTVSEKVVASGMKRAEVVRRACGN
jgi:hypothetical protein